MESPTKLGADCWNDNARMTVLFSPFRPKSINPTDWDSKMKFWESSVHQFCETKKKVTVNLAELNSFFILNEKKPCCLDTVIENMLKNGTLITNDMFNKITEDSWRRWAVEVLVSSPLKWTFNKMKSAIIAPSQQADVSYINLQVVKQFGCELLNKVPEEMKGKLLDVNTILNLSGISKEDLSLVLQWLRHQQEIAITKDIPPTELVKISKNGRKPVVITEVDTGIYSLEVHEKGLIKNIEKLEEEKLMALNEAKKYIAAKMQSMAKSSLRKKKALEKYIDKRTSALENVQSLLYRLQQSESDALVLDCYKMGLRALNTTFQENGLSEANVNNTMDELEEALDVHNEIEESLSRSMGQEDLDLEMELSDLLADGVSPPADGSSGGRTENQLPHLPEVPQSSLPASPRPVLPTVDEADFERRLKALSL